MSAASASWEQLLPAALNGIWPPERALLHRIAEARGRRVPVSELATSFGLPGTASLEQDFPGLSRFVAERKASGEKIEMPIVSGGSDDKGWYWMAPATAGEIRQALAAPETPSSPAGSSAGGTGRAA